MTPELAYFLKINVAIALFFTLSIGCFFIKTPSFTGDEPLCYASSAFPALSLIEYSRVDKGTGAYGGNGGSLCHNHSSGANH